MTWRRVHAERSAPSLEPNTRTSSKLLARAIKIYEGLQVSHHGKYSLERLQSLEEYCRTTPVWRVVLVCAATPFPALVVTLLLESIPLEAPSAGCLANYRFWIRFFIVGIFAGLSNLLRAKKWLPELPLTGLQVVAIAVAASTVVMGIFLVMGTMWVFPIPFALLFGSTPLLIVWVTGLYFVVGTRMLTEVEGFKFRALQYFNLIGVEGSLMLVYPAYQAIFVSLRAEYQPALVFVLPLIKVVLKNQVAGYAAHCEDFLPETVAFTVEFFNAFYNVVCMQNAGSKWTVLLIIANDVLFTALSLRNIYNRTNISHQLHKQYHQGKDGELDLLATILKLAQEPHELDQQDLNQIRLRACTQHKLSRAATKMLDRLEERQVYWNQREYTQQQLLDVRAQKLVSWKGSAAVVPSTPVPLESILSPSPSQNPTKKKSIVQAAVSPLERIRPARRSSINASEPLTPSQKTRVIHENLQLLFKCEYIALVEYIECIAPIIYAIYLPVLYSLPNAKFFPNTRNLSSESVNSLIVNLFCYGCLEVASFATLHGILKRKFAFSPVYQVAFVLETQMLLVQGKLIVWLLFALQFTIDHLGESTLFADF